MRKVVAILLVFLGFACTENRQSITVTIENNLDINRVFETVEISSTQLESIKAVNYKVIDVKTNKELISQAVDSNQDGTIDILLFQPEISANSKKTFKIFGEISNEKQDSTLIRCYSRFVPERTDDYAWENDKVAFRTFGPTAQKMVEENIKGGTLTSGIDAWLKKVDYPIINKWYKKTTTGKGSYHEDTGEGLDNFHVGVSRGVGGVAVKKDATFYFSKNFISWETICNGPIRTSFILTYADWDANGNLISEKKQISLDYGSSLSKFEIFVRGTETLSVGLTLHEKDGISNANVNQGWVSYWEPNGYSELGTGVVVPNETLISFENYFTNETDESNLYVHIKVSDNTVVYYAGFGWKERGEFKTREAWEQYLNQFSEKLKSPMMIKLK